MNPPTEGDQRNFYAQGRPQAKDASGAGANWKTGTTSDSHGPGWGAVESRMFYEGTVTATDMSRATDAREAGRIGIFGTSNSYGGAYGRVTSEAIGRDLNPLGRGGGWALVGGMLNLGGIAPSLPMTGWTGGEEGNSVNNPGCQSCGFVADDLNLLRAKSPTPSSLNDAKPKESKVTCCYLVPGLGGYKLDKVGGTKCHTYNVDGSEPNRGDQGPPPGGRALAYTCCWHCYILVSKLAKAQLTKTECQKRHGTSDGAPPADSFIDDKVTCELVEGTTDLPACEHKSPDDAWSVESSVFHESIYGIYETYAKQYVKNCGDTGRDSTEIGKEDGKPSPGKPQAGGLIL